MGFYVSLFEDAKIINKSYLTESVKGGEVLSCGWLKDKYGLTWQIVPECLDVMMRDPDPVKAERVSAAKLGMEGKLNISELEKAYRGE